MHHHHMELQEQEQEQASEVQDQEQDFEKCASRPRLVWRTASLKLLLQNAKWSDNIAVKCENDHIIVDM